MMHYDKYKNQQKNKRKAFTLIEMLAVVSLVAILFIIFIPRVDFATNKVKEAGLLVDFRSYQIAFSQSDKIDPDILNKTGSEQVSIINKYLDPDLQIVYEDGTGYSIPNAKDPWGTNYRFISNSGKAYLLSAGPDKQFSDTEDSIIRDLQHASMVVTPLSSFTAYAYSGEATQADPKNLDNYALIVEYDTDGSSGIVSSVVKPTITGSGSSGSIEVTLESISVTKQPDKTSYFEGENFDPTGMEVTATYSDGNTEVLDIKQIQITNGTNLTVGQESVTINYTDGSTTLETSIVIVVGKNVIQSISVTKQPDKTSYLEGENFDPTGMEVTATYSDGKTVVLDLSSIEILDGNNLQLGTDSLVISYTEEDKSVQCSVSITVEVISVDSILNKTKFNNAVSKETATSITFGVKSGTNPVEVSDDGNILAALDGTAYYVYNKTGGKIVFPEDCSELFRYYSTTDIEFGSEIIDTSNVTDMSHMFCQCEALTSLDISSFDTSNVTSMISMFYGCESLTSLDISNFNTSNVTDMNKMFEQCRSLNSLDLSNFNTSNVTDMSRMFYWCTTLKSIDLSNFNTSNVTDMNKMFGECSLLTSFDLSSFDTSNVTNMYCMFASCYYLKSLDLSSFDTSNVTDMGDMFYDCSSLRSLDISSFDTSNVTYINGMFRSCDYLTSLDLSSFDTSNVTDMGRMFEYCSRLNSLDLSSFDTSNVTDMDNMFKWCYSLDLCYGCTQDDCDRFNNSSEKPSNVNFVVK